MSEWRPRCDADVAERRAALLNRVRDYFAEQRVMPVDTPVLGVTGVTDPNIETLRTGDGAFLQTSPEYYMKRLLAAGYPDIYSIGRVFRGGEQGNRHLSEFTMIEWYRLGMILQDIIGDTLRLIAHVLDQPRLVDTADRYDYTGLFEDHCGIDPLSANTSRLASACSADDSLKATLADDRDAWLDCLLATRVVPALPDGRLTIIAHYPASQAALARLCPSDPNVADRFEVYLGPVELANGYVELTDPVEQARRMQIDNNRRRHLGRTAVAADRNLLYALQHGLPACAGVALGFERLHMVADGASDIRDVVCFADC